MYHPHRLPLTLLPLLAVAMLAFAPLTAQAQSQPAPPDPVYFRIQAELGNHDRLKGWLDAGLDPDYLGDRIGSGLMIAAWEGNIPLMELFLARGAHIDRTNALGETALMHAAWKGHAEAVRWLLDHGATLNREAMQWSALHYAAFAGHDGIAEQLLDRGANIDARSPNGSSVLMMAIYEGRESTVRQLLARGADTQARNENGDGALEWAMKFNQTKIARMVATRAEFQIAASRPKADWGEVRKSEPMPRELEELLAIRQALATRNLSLDKVDKRIAAARAKHAAMPISRATGKEGTEGASAILEVSAERAAPSKQRLRLVKTPAGQYR